MPAITKTELKQLYTDKELSRSALSVLDAIAQCGNTTSSLKGTLSNTKKYLRKLGVLNDDNVFFTHGMAVFWLELRRLVMWTETERYHAIFNALSELQIEGLYCYLLGISNKYSKNMKNAALPALKRRGLVTSNGKRGPLAVTTFAPGVKEAFINWTPVDEVDEAPTTVVVDFSGSRTRPTTSASVSALSFKHQRLLLGLSDREQQAVHSHLGRMPLSPEEQGEELAEIEAYIELCSEPQEDWRAAA